MADDATLSEANVANLFGALATLVADGVGGSVAVEPSEVPKVTALALIAKYPGCSIEQLRGPLALSHSGCVRVVDRLVDDDLVERGRSDDGRAVALRLTRRGRAAAHATTASRESFLRDVLGSLTDGERERLAPILMKLLDRATPTPRAAARTCRLCDYAACVRCPFRERFADPG